MAKKKKFYAIKQGFNPIDKVVMEDLILSSWDEAKPLVQGISKYGVTAKYKSFDSFDEAKEYISSDDPLLLKSNENYPMDALHCYVDGSFSGELHNYSYGLVCVKDGELLQKENGVGTNKAATSMQQVGGELLGAMKALLYAKNHNYKEVVIFHDYMGVCYHAVGEWKRDNDFSESYYQWMQNFMNSMPEMNIVFCKVDAHTGDDFNEIADGEAKIALGIQPNPIYYKALDKYIRN